MPVLKLNLTSSILFLMFVFLHTYFSGYILFVEYIFFIPICLIVQENNSQLSIKASCILFQNSIHITFLALLAILFTTLLFSLYSSQFLNSLVFKYIFLHCLSNFPQTSHSAFSNMFIYSSYVFNCFCCFFVKLLFNEKTKILLERNLFSSLLILQKISVLHSVHNTRLNMSIMKSEQMIEQKHKYSRERIFHEENHHKINNGRSNVGSFCTTEIKT